MHIRYDIWFIDSPALNLCGSEDFKESLIEEKELAPFEFIGDSCFTAFCANRAVLPIGTVALPGEGQSPVKWIKRVFNDLLPGYSQAIQYGYFKLRHYWCRLVNSLIGGKGVDLLCLTTSKPFSLTQHMTKPDLHEQE